MKSATAAAGMESSYKGWTCSRPKHQVQPANAFQHMHVSPSFQHMPSCRVQTSAPRYIMCRDQIVEDARCSTKARRMRWSKRDRIQKSSITTDTAFSSRSSNSHRVPALPIVSTTPIATTINAGPNTTISTTTSTTTDEHIHKDPPSPYFTRRPENDEVGVQELTVYEVNERDRDSPVLLFSSKLAVDWYKRLPSLGGLGDLVPFTNKLFDGSLKKRLGITAGIITVIQYYPKEKGFLFESVYSFYFGDFGHISVKGPYKTHEDTILTVTGGSGFFVGVYGTVQISNVEFPTVLFYKFKLYGIPQLPKALRWKTIPPSKGLRPARNASLPRFALPNFTD